MSSKMLIDAAHPEETRVVVLKGNRVEEFDFESANKKQLRGNIYLAKVTRVEPSLQAAFIDYGGNRHGFLAFAEIHPEYYHIPIADRQALVAEEALAHRDEDEDSRNGGHRRSRRHRREGAASPLDRRGIPDDSISETASSNGGERPYGSDLPAGGPHEGLAFAGFDTVSEPAGVAYGDGEPVADMASMVDEVAEVRPDQAGSADASETAWPLSSAFEDDRTDGHDAAARSGTPETAVANADALGEDSQTSGSFDPGAPRGEGQPRMPSGNAPEVAREDLPPLPGGAPDAEFDDESGEEREEEAVEQIGGEEDDAVQRPPRARRHYKIQEVIKRRQILLVQVVKEERGNKGAALTTYLSLAGRYSVLMPNTARGGGISRKITEGDDRKRLKSIAGDLEVPEGMGLILRTAAAARSKVEVKRDFEYLLRMWESVRELTLGSTAPTLVYEEGSLIKRSIRDLYTNDVESVLVAGEEGFREARDFMGMLMPGAAKTVQLYRDPQPIFAKAGAEAQLDSMFSNHVTLRSGGYLVINQTEALVAIDVNSGRSTREHNIEDTALRTNLEAADEIARQLRLRDLAGLIVVDFIDMEEGRNNRAVERRIKDALKNDRARIQIGRISHFGLLEMSRQRIRTGVLEGSTVICPHCAGAGTVRSTASIALHVLRLLEDALIKDASHSLIVRTRTEVALYILNQKRSNVIHLETRFGVSLSVMADPTLTGMVYHAIERGELAALATVPAPRPNLVRVDSIAPVFDVAPETSVFDDGSEETEGDDESDAGDVPAAVGSERDGAQADMGGGDPARRRRRRRRRRGRERDGLGSEVAADGPQPSDAFLADLARIGGDLPGTEAEGRDVRGDVPMREGGPTGGEAAASPRSSDHVSEVARTPRDDTAVLGPPVVDDAAPLAEPGPAEPGPAEEAADVPPPRRRSRRAASRADAGASSTVVAPSGAEAEGGTSSGEVAARSRRSRRSPRPRVGEQVSAGEAERASEPGESRQAPRPAADRDVGADTVEHHPPLEGAAGDGAAFASDSEPSVPEQRPVSDFPKTAAPPPSLPAPAESGPAGPKRSGWWQRAKATFGS